MPSKGLEDKYGKEHGRDYWQTKEARRKKEIWKRGYQGKYVDLCIDASYPGTDIYFLLHTHVRTCDSFSGLCAGGPVPG